MGVSSSIAASIDALKRNPVLFVAAFVVGLVNSAALGVQSMAPPERMTFFSTGASFVIQLLALFFVGGAYAMASESLRGKTTLRTLVAAGKANYLSLLGATILVVVVTGVTFVAIAIVGVVGVLGVGMSVGGGSVPAFVLVLAGLYLLGFLPLFFLQFYGPAVVVSDLGAVGSLKRSFALVRRNLLSTLGFDAVVVAMGLVGTAPSVVLYATQFDSLTADGTFSLFAGLGPSMLAGYFVSTLILGTLTGAFFWTYQVSFYEQLDERLSASA